MPVGTDEGGPWVGGVYALGVGIGTLAAWQALANAESLVLLALEAGVPAALSTAVFYGCYRITRSERAEQRAQRVLAAAVLLAAAGLVVVGVDALSNSLAGEPQSDLAFTSVLVLAMSSTLAFPVGIYYDEAVTKRKELAAELDTITRLNEQLDRTNQRLVVINRVVRHNLRTELTLLSAYYVEILSRIDAEAVDVDLSACRTALENLDSIERKTGYVERLWPPRSDAREDRGTDDAVTVLTRQIEALRTRTPDVEVAATLPESVVVPDHPLFEVAVSELLDNAVSHNDHDDLRIDVSVACRPADGVVEVTVADTGSGIPQFELEPLDRGTESPLAHSSGIGLWVVHWTANEMGGGVRFETNEAGGTTVTMTLPAET